MTNKGISVSSCDSEVRKKKKKIKALRNTKNKIKVKSSLNRSFTSNVVDCSSIDTLEKYSNKKACNTIINYSSGNDDWKKFDTCIYDMNTIKLPTTEVNNTRRLDLIQNVKTTNTSESIADLPTQLNTDLTIKRSLPLDNDQLIESKIEKSYKYNQINNNICSKHIQNNIFQSNHDICSGSREYKFQLINKVPSNIQNNNRNLTEYRKAKIPKEKDNSRVLQKNYRNGVSRSTSKSMVIAAFSTDSRRKFTKHQLPVFNKKVKKSYYDHTNADFLTKQKSIINIGNSDIFLLSKRSKITYSKYNLRSQRSFKYRKMMFSQTDLSDISMVNTIYKHTSHQKNNEFLKYDDYHNSILPQTHSESIPENTYDMAYIDKRLDSNAARLITYDEYASKGLRSNIPLGSDTLLHLRESTQRIQVFDHPAITNNYELKENFSYGKMPIDEEINQGFYNDESSSDDYSEILEMTLPDAENTTYNNIDIINELDDMQRMLKATPCVSSVLLARPSSYYMRLTFDDDDSFSDYDQNADLNYDYSNTIFDHGKHDIRLQDRLDNDINPDIAEIDKAEILFDLDKFSNVPEFAVERFKSINQNIDIGEYPEIIEQFKVGDMNIVQNKSVGKLPIVCSNDQLDDCKLPNRYISSSKLSLKTISEISIGSIPDVASEIDINRKFSKNNKILKLNILNKIKPLIEEMNNDPSVDNTIDCIRNDKIKQIKLPKDNNTEIKINKCRKDGKLSNDINNMKEINNHKIQIFSNDKKSIKECKKEQNIDPLFGIITGDMNIELRDVNDRNRKGIRLGFIKSAVSSKPERVNSMPNRLISNKTDGSGKCTNKAFASQIKNDICITALEKITDNTCGDIGKKKEENIISNCQKRSFQIIDNSYNDIMGKNKIENIILPNFNQEIIVNTMQDLKFNSEYTKASSPSKITDNDIFNNKKYDTKIKKTSKKINNPDIDDYKKLSRHKSNTKHKYKKDYKISLNRKSYKSVLKKVSSLSLNERRKQIIENLKKDRISSIKKISKLKLYMPINNDIKNNNYFIKEHRMNDAKKQMDLRKITQNTEPSHKEKTRHNSPLNDVSIMEQSTQVRTRSLDVPSVRTHETIQLNNEIDSLKKENESSKFRYLQLQQADQEEIKHYKNIINKLKKTQNSTKHSRYLNNKDETVSIFINIKL